MAEVVLGTVTSGFAVASLAIQLVEVLQRLHAFWDSFDDSNANIKHRKRRLSLLRTISANIIDICQERPSITCGDAVIKSLNNCMTSANALNDLIADHHTNQADSRMKRVWSTLRVTLKEKTIRRTESQLKADMEMLLVALQPFFHQVHIASLTAITTQPSTPQKPHGDLESRKRDMAIDSIQEHLPVEEYFVNHVSKGRLVNGRLVFFQLRSQRWSFKLDLYTALEKTASVFGFPLPRACRTAFQGYPLGLVYTTSNHLVNPFPTEILRPNIKRRLKVMLPRFSFQIQISTLPLTLVSHQIVCCRSQIFRLCEDGNVDAVKLFFIKNSWASPFAVNQHGENLLHAAARYAQADLCCFLLDIGVDGSAFDDRLLTPLDHLARKVYPGLRYRTEVVDTIRALVERGKCYPMLPLTSNAVSLYRGPEEGFALLFSSEYTGVNLEERDSESWTLLGDAAFNFGWWTELCVEDAAPSWQASYLLRAGANPHSKSSEDGLTPLDTFLRGCTRNQVDHGTKWIQVLARNGVDLNKYGRAEQELHASEHYLMVSWDDELWKWIPTKRSVVFRYSDDAPELEIWLEDYDALSWFRCGRYDLEIFQVCSPAGSMLRWKELNAQDDCFQIDEMVAEPHLGQAAKHSHHRAIDNLMRTHWFQLLVATLVCNYMYHVFLIHV